MKKTLLILCVLLLTCTSVMSQFVEQSDSTMKIDETQVADSLLADTLNVVLIIDEMVNAIVHQDSALTSLMIDKHLGRIRGEQLIDGFRVQIYASNAQQMAKNEALMLQQRIVSQLEVPVYTMSEPPFWRLRLGNFKTREEANQYKNIFLNLFPDMVGSTYVVPDKVVIIQ